MIGKLILLLVAMLASAGAWLFWHEAQAEGFNIITLVAIIALAADNYRLRKTIRSLGGVSPRGHDH